MLKAIILHVKMKSLNRAGLILQNAGENHTVSFWGCDWSLPMKHVIQKRNLWIYQQHTDRFCWFF